MLADGAVGVFGWVPPVPPPVLAAPTELGVRSWVVSSGGPSEGRTGGALPGAEDGGSGGGWDCGVPAGSGSGVGGILGAWSSLARGTFCWWYARMESARPCSTASAAVLARWVVKTYMNWEGGFPGTPAAPPLGASGRRPGGGPCGGPGVLFSLRDNWVAWPGPSCGVAMAGSATLQLWGAVMGLSSSSLSGPEHHSSPL